MSVVANVAINVDSRNAVSKLREVQNQAQQTEKTFNALQSALGALGVGFALTKVIGDVKELDTNLRRLATVGVDVAKINPALSKLSDELGGVANKAELAAASYQAASAGFSDTAGNINILRAATKAATGGLADTQAVTEVLVKTLNSYGMSGNQAIQVTDSISKAVELGNQEWSDYTSQLGRVASIAALAGVSLDEVNAFIASATKNGATAEIAFTGLGATLNTLLQPTKESQEAASKLGIAWNYGGLQAKGFTGLMSELAVAMEKDKETTAKLLGSQEAMRGAFAAASKSGSDFKNILGEIGNATGKTDADFQTMKGSIENTLKALDTSFKNLSEALGIAFGPTVVIVVQDITKAINGFADFMATVPQPVMNTTGELVKLIAQMLLLQKAIQAIIALRAAFIGAMVGMTGATVASGTAATTSANAFALYTRNTQTLATAATGATSKLTALRGILSGIASIGIITVGINIIVSGLQETIAAQAELNKLRRIKAAGGAAGTFAGATAETVTGAQQTARQTIAATQAERQRLNAPGARILQQLNVGGVLSPFGVKSIVGASERNQLLNARERNAQAKMGLSVAGRPNNGRVGANTTSNNITDGAGVTDDGKKKKGKSDAEKAAELAAKQAEQLMGAKMQLDLARQLFAIENRVIAARFEGNKPLELARETQKELATIAGEAAAIKVDKDIPADRKLVELNKLKVKSAEAARSLAVNIAQIEIDRNKSFDEIITGLNLELALKTATTEQAREQLRLEAERAKLEAQLKGMPQPQIDQAIALQAQIAAPLTDAQNIEQKIGKLKDEITDLTNISNAAITSAEGIGNAFAQSFQGLVSGTMTAQEALGSFFRSVADMFLEMAAQIIAKQMAMIVLQTILKALGGGGGGAFGGAPSAPSVDYGFTPSFGSGFAKGGAFTNSIVSAPTMFPFADGGTTRMGLMGEAGPEAIMPLKRGADGKLGVAAQMDGAMQRYRRSSSATSAATGGAGGTDGTEATSGPATIDVRYSVERINDVEYVTASQFQEGMREAAKQGAAMGRNNVYSDLINKRSVRQRMAL